MEAKEEKFDVQISVFFDITLAKYRAAFSFKFSSTWRSFSSRFERKRYDRPTLK